MLSRNDVLQKVNFYKTLKAIYNTDVVNRRNLLLFGTTAIRGGVEQCTSVYIAQRRVLLCKNSPLHGTTDIRVRFEMYILVNSWTRVLAKPKHHYCMEPLPSVAVLSNVPPCTLLNDEFLLCKNVATLTGCQCWQRLSNNKI